MSSCQRFFLTGIALALVFSMWSGCLTRSGGAASCVVGGIKITLPSAQKTATPNITVVPESAGRGPVIGAFTANPAEIIAGDKTTLEWQTTGATTITLEPGIGTAIASGSIILTPEKDTTYILTASNSSGSAQRSVTVYVSTPAPPPTPVNPAAPAPVPAPSSAPIPIPTPFPVPGPIPAPALPPPEPPPAASPVINSFTADPASVAAGSCSALGWSTTGATSVTLNPGGAVPVNGSVPACPAVTTTYILTATNAAGSITDTETVTVTGAPPPEPPPPAESAACEQSLFDAVNALRAADGKAALARNAYIDGLCRQHAQYMADHNVLSHDNFITRVNSIRANIPGTNPCAENVLQSNIPCDANDMANMWFNSPGHKANMLNAAYTLSGMGIAIDAGGKIWACQMFAGP